MSEEDKTFSDEWLVPSLADLLTPDQIEDIRAEVEPHQALWDQVVARSLLSNEQILASLSTKFRLKLADVSQLDVSVRDIVPEAVARRYHILPLSITDSHLDVATATPFDLDAEKSLSFATGREVRMHLASPSTIRDRTDDLYRPERALDKLLEGMEGHTELTQLDEASETEDLMASEEEASQRPVVRLVDLILSEGILARASDIHIETEEDGVAVRYRIDGVLRQVMKIPRRAGVPLISRIKIMSGLDIADRLRPQDGRSRVGVNGVPVDLRVSTLPASLGEKVVIRILDSRSTVLKLDAVGLSPTETEHIYRLLENREGILLVTGPTGSGKTTTLYATIRHVQSEGVNIVTVEDPVEYRMQGIVQVQVHEKAGLTFGAALRSILRQDPDVVLIGEIRDRETAQIAVQASLTGHLVLSTLHTNDAANAVTRLIDLGVEPYKVASALRGVVAQRLLRKLCSTCKEVWMEAPPERIRQWIPQGTPLYRAGACPDCAMTGYRGRFAIVEVLTATPEVERKIAEGAPADLIAEAAAESGSRSLWDSGVAHVLKGETTLDELQRVVDVPHSSEGKGSAPAPPAPPPRSSRAVGTASAAPPPAPEVAAPLPSPAKAPPRAASFDLSELQLIDDEPTAATAARTVLLVDDEDSLRKVMRDLLERDGYVVAEARDGVQALDQVDRVGPDIIVLDLNLPGLDGYGVLSHLRSRPATADIPVIVLTAKGDEDNEVRVFELGADDFLTKPFRARALSARLEAVLGRRR